MTIEGPAEIVVDDEPLVTLAAETELPEATPPKRRRLEIFSIALAVLFIFITLWRAGPGVYDAYNFPRYQATDYHYLYWAGLLSTSDEVKHLYGPEPQLEAWASTHNYNYPVYYPYAPVVAFATGGLRIAGENDGVIVWRVLVALATAALTFLVVRSFKSWYWRAVVAVAMVCWEPLLLNARIGQTGAFIALATALSVTVFLRNKNLGAILMGLMAVKPTAVVGPTLLIFQEKLSIWARFGGAAMLIVLPPFLYLGPRQLAYWIDILSSRGVRDIGAAGGSHYYNQGFTSALGWSNAAGLMLAIVMLIIAALVVQGVQARLGVLAGAAFALCIANLVNPHSLIYDWGTAFVVVMLLRQSTLLREDLRDLGIGALVITLFIAGQLAWSVRLHEYAVRPLTIWGICLTLLLLAVAFWPVVVAFIKQPRLAGAPQTVAAGPQAGPRSEPTGSSNKARRRRERREIERRGRG